LPDRSGYTKWPYLIRVPHKKKRKKKKEKKKEEEEEVSQRCI